MRLGRVFCEEKARLKRELVKADSETVVGDAVFIDFSLGDVTQQSPAVISAGRGLGRDGKAE